MSPALSLIQLSEPLPDPSHPHTPHEHVSEGDTTAALFDHSLQQQAKAVLAYLNQVTGKRYPTTRNILGVLRDKKGTVAQCKLVIDWWLQSWGVQYPTQAGLLNPDTPFKEKFEIYLADAEHWHEGGRQAPPGPQSKNSHRPQNSNDDLMASMQMLEEQQRATK